MVDVIQAKKDGQALTEEQIRHFTEGVVSGDVPDYQAAALLMAICFRGMNPEETLALTMAMVASGDQTDLSSIPGVKVDKHSTGGVGDKTTLILAPLVAACGVPVAKMSGRGLGHTGGTIDKLESIPGFSTELSMEKFLHNVREYGLAVAGQTGHLVPADKKLYALRDVTATIDNVSLIAASIMSKKLAAGLDALVLDVKWGSGAFMPTLEQARSLAGSLMDVGRRMGKRTAALITDMNHPLGRSAGNSLEVRESVEALKGNAPPDLEELTVELCAAMLVLGGLLPALEPARLAARERLRSGKAFARFRRMVELHGGDPSALDNPALLPGARIRESLRARRNGCLERIDAGMVGRACLVLGAGRRSAADPIDHGVGVSDIAERGRQCRAGDVLAVVNANARGACEEAMRILDGAVIIGDAPAAPPEIIQDRIGL